MIISIHLQFTVQTNKFQFPHSLIKDNISDSKLRKNLCNFKKQTDIILTLEGIMIK